MSRTLKAIMRHMVPPTKREPVPAKNRNLTAEWQNGVETICAYPQRKLRLVFARTPLGERSPASL
jgi:hypothetical protein